MGNCLEGSFDGTQEFQGAGASNATTNSTEGVPQPQAMEATQQTEREKRSVDIPQKREFTGSRDKGMVVLDSGTGESKIIFVCQDANENVAVEELQQLMSLKGLHANEDRENAMKSIAEALQNAAEAKPGAGLYVGLTAWFRDKKTSEAEKEFVRSFFRTRVPAFVVMELRGDEEAMYEATAVTYAATKSGIGKPMLQMAAGGGSINIVFGGKPYNIQTGFRAGQSVLMEKGILEVPKLEAEAKEYVDKFFQEHAAFKEQCVDGFVIAISACYYAAKGTGIATEEAQLANHIVDTFEQRKEALVEGIAEGAKPEKKVAQEIANMILQKELFKRICAPEAKVFFRRDWKIDGVPFRTTWTSGFFIEGAGQAEK